MRIAERAPAAAVENQHDRFFEVFWVEHVVAAIRVAHRKRGCRHADFEWRDLGRIAGYRCMRGA